MPSIEVHLHLTGGAVREEALPALQHAIVCGRPDISDVFTRVKAADDLAGGSGTMGFVCGPAAMIWDVRRAGLKHGVPIHAESFEM